MYFAKVLTVATLFAACSMAAATNPPAGDGKVKDAKEPAKPAELSAITSHLTGLLGDKAADKDKAVADELNKKEVWDIVAKIPTKVDVHKAAIVSLKAHADAAKLFKAKDDKTAVPDVLTAAIKAVKDLAETAPAVEVSKAVTAMIKEVNALDKTKFDVLIDLPCECRKILDKAIADAGDALTKEDREKLAPLVDNCSCGSMKMILIIGGVAVLLIVIIVAVVLVMRRK